ncbi:MAG: methionine sulfoxide reductase [Flavobacteriales bacterium]|nr:methionine sulfoxide reductase [Flavobacteriales bacterium]
MKNFKICLLIILLINMSSCQAQTNSTKTIQEVKENNYRKLTDEEARVIIHKGTEYPFTGEYNTFKDQGVFHCKQCNTPLFSSKDKFNSGSGWPSFDDIIGNNVSEIPDSDGSRTEIVCATCGGHLGHVFRGEGFTDKNTRHCVNSISLQFESSDQSPRDTAVFASGCFWGTEYHLQRLEGVIDTKPGYIGGHVKNPSYQQVCSGNTGHAEAVRVIFNPNIVTYEEIAKLYFETHDPTQIDRQGPDIGTQYRSEIFYSNDMQKKIANDLIKKLEAKGLKVATKLTVASTFWVAEDYHQDYYIKTGKQPYCHKYTKRF